MRFKQDIRLLADHASDGPSKERLASLADSEAFKTAVVTRVSILDLLEQYPTITLPFHQFLALLPPLSPRHYSISSSPLADPTSCTLTYSVIDEPTWSDSGKRFHGVAGTYLASLKPGDQALVAVRATSNKFFHLPADPETTPLLLFCAGSGIAPFVGFLQERAVLKRQGGRKLAPAVMFVGCRHPERDRLYADEMDGWVRDGIVDVRYAFSQAPEHELAGGCLRVPDRMAKEKQDLFALFDAGAKVFTCGSAEFAKTLSVAAVDIALEKKRAEGGKDVSREEVERWFQRKRNERFVSDVFS